MLRKDICKKCRIADYGSEKGWNEYSEAWFEANKIRPGHVHCPPNVTLAVYDSIIGKIQDTLTEEELKLSTVGYALSIIGRGPCIVTLVKNPPPWWCPRAAEHGVGK